MLIAGIVQEGELGGAEEAEGFLGTPNPGAASAEVFVRAHADTMFTLGSFWVQGPVEAR